MMDLVPRSAPSADSASLTIPRDREHDYTVEMADRRRKLMADRAGVELSHIGQYSFDPSVLAGNVENFIGVAQVPIGVAGPLRINGEHARGDFLIPMATTEGTLVASYNRGMRLLSTCGGVTTTVVEEYMQRGPAFSFASAVAARDFGAWVVDRYAEIKAVAESTTRVGCLENIGQYQVGPLRYLRFNYHTGDAAGQNMTGKATQAACEWIGRNHPDHPSYLLSGNIDTDKKQSHTNTLLTRGRRVVAEAVLTRDALRDIVGVEPADLFRWRQVSMTGTFLAGAASNGAQAANALAV